MGEEVGFDEKVHTVFVDSTFLGEDNLPQLVMSKDRSTAYIVMVLQEKIKLPYETCIEHKKYLETGTGETKKAGWGKVSEVRRAVEKNPNRILSSVNKDLDGTHLRGGS